MTMTNARIMLDLNYPAEYGTDIHEGYFKVISDQEIEGYADTRVAGDYILHYNIKFNKPFKTFNGWKDDKVEKTSENGNQMAIAADL